CSKSVVGLVIPTGYSFNLDGTSIYLSMATVFLAQVFGVDLSIGQQITIILVLMLTSKGAAGVTGSGFIVLASTLSALQVIPLEGLALL
ncbi:cation:dicarboxylate symporter family transporter, partial [Enterococcus faecalis]